MSHAETYLNVSVDIIQPIRGGGIARYSATCIECFLNWNSDIDATVGMYYLGVAPDDLIR